MSKKRWISLLLTLSLCLGLLPGMTLASGEGTESDLPEGYEQMYVQDGDGYAASVEGAAGAGGDIWLYSWADDVYSVLNDTEVYTISCDTQIGEVGKGANGTNWRKGNALPGAEGYIYATNKNDASVKYAIKARVGAPIVGVYSDANLENYLTQSARIFEFSEESKPTVYLAAGNDTVNITGITGQNSRMVEYEVPSDGARSVAVTVAGGVTENFATRLLVSLSNGNEFTVDLNFVFVSIGDNTPTLDVGVYTTLIDGQLGGYVEMTRI